MSARLALDDVGLKPSAAVLQPCAAHVASASDSLRCLEQRLADRASLDSDVAAATTLVVDAATELRAAFAFIDQLEESVASASLLIEATERRLAVYERGERLPESLLSLPPAMLTHHQFLRQLQRRECHPLPDLPELTMLPPPSTRPSEPWPAAAAAAAAAAAVTAASTAAAAATAAATAAASAAGGVATTSAPSGSSTAAIPIARLQTAGGELLEGAAEHAAELEQLARTAASRARDTAQKLWSSGSDGMLSALDRWRV